MNIDEAIANLNKLIEWCEANSLSGLNIGLYRTRNYLVDKRRRDNESID